MGRGDALWLGGEVLRAWPANRVAARMAEAADDLVRGWRAARSARMRGIAARVFRRDRTQQGGVLEHALRPGVRVEAMLDQCL